MPQWLSTLLAVFGAVATAYGLWAGGYKAYRSAKATGKPAPPTWPEVWARLDEQQSQIGDLRTDVDTLRRTEGRLVGWVARLHQGITDGTIPPIPAAPPWLVERLEDYNFTSSSSHHPD